MASLILPGAGFSQVAPASQVADRTFPFHIYSNHIFLTVRANGSPPLSFILDSGASVSVLHTRNASAAKIPPPKPRARKGAGAAAESEVYEANNIPLSLDGFDVPAKEIVVLPLGRMESVFGRSIDGILGPDIFEHYVVELDYQQRTVTLRDPRTFHYSGAGTAIPLQLQGHRPYARVRIDMPDGRSQEGSFLLDIGAKGAVGLQTPFVKKHGLPGAGQDTILHYSYFVTGESPELLGRVKTVHLGPFLIDNPVAAFSQAREGSAMDRSYDGSIGGEIFRKFKVTFDYSRKQIILEKTAEFDDPYGADMSGLTLLAPGEGFKAIRVEHVLEKSPANAAGLREADVLEAIDGQPVGSITLEQLRKLFEQERTYKLQIRRGEQIVEVALSTKKLI